MLQMEMENPLVMAAQAKKKVASTSIRKHIGQAEKIFIC